MTLFHNDIPLDGRRMVAYARDISAISEAEYAQLAPPDSLKTFPDDLQNPALEFAGIYEDGWVSENAHVRLTAPVQESQVVVRGMLPAPDGDGTPPELHILVDGQESVRQVLSPGDFEVRSRAIEGSGAHRVELRFSASRSLPAPDGRVVAAQLHSVGIELASPVEAPADLTLGTGWYPPEVFGGQQFRWAANDPRITVTGDGQRNRVLRLDLEPGPGVGSRPFTIEVLDQQGQAVATAYVQGRQTLEVPLNVTAGDSEQFTFHVVGGGGAAPNDPRTLNFRVFAFSWAS
jgi:hypothetical protein